MEYQTVILTAPQDLPSPPAPGRLAISGLSVVFYCAHRLAPAAMRDAVSDHRLTEFTDDRSYAEKVRPGSGFFYSTLIESGPLPDALRRQLRCTHAPPLQQSLVWYGDEYVLSALPILLSNSPDDARAIQLAERLAVDDLINFLALLSSPGQAALLAGQAAEALIAGGIFKRSDIEFTWALPGNFGIQIWNLDGTADRSTNDLYRGTADSVRYAWEIAAVLSYNSEHLLERGLWLRRSPQQVFGQVRAGFSFFEDHMVFLNADCCLEMSHLPAWLRSNSEFRLSEYGYDSSSVYLWTAGMLQKAVIEDLGRRYRKLTADLAGRAGMGAAEHSRLMQAQLRNSSLLDRMANFRSYLAEARSRAFDEAQAMERSLDRGAELLRREIEKTVTLSDGLLRVHEEAAQSRRDAALATIGVGLGASQIPGFIGQMQVWAEDGDWAPLAISSVLIIAALLVVPYIWYRRKHVDE